ncbi:hypothetical protein O181_120930 [Austropuccinia psidii MF-1]|uniref:Uncharacterized protein n=1 Tax=Austropuccinia psidii MF-1 TaxID=1389203 RepID=A0A9Q3KL67_9BASI|nr:hypothetical protein [Austropuccinia psidii MF-1]
MFTTGGNSYSESLPNTNIRLLLEKLDQEKLPNFLRTTMRPATLGIAGRLAVPKPDMFQHDQSFAPKQSQHENPSQPSSHNQITNSDSINPPSNPSSSDSFSNSYSNLQ